MSNNGPERYAFSALISLAGTALDATHTKALALQEPINDDGLTDCWTHAWELAWKLGLEYWEGRCRKPGDPKLHLHAWCVDPQTKTIFETTRGYEDAYDYMGFRINKDEAAKATQKWPRTRASVFEAIIAAQEALGG